MNHKPLVALCSVNERLVTAWQQALYPIATTQVCDSLQTLADACRFRRPAMTVFHIDGKAMLIDEALTAVLDHEGTHTLVLDEKPNDEDGVVLVKAGVRGYANSSMEGRLLQTAITTILDGDVWVARRIMQRLVNELLNGDLMNGQTGHPTLEHLTDRELEIAVLVAEGSSNKIVATRLGITERTVKAHLTSAFNKTGARGRLDLSLMVKGEYSPAPQLIVS